MCTPSGASPTVLTVHLLEVRRDFVSNAVQTLTGRLVGSVFSNAPLTCAWGLFQAAAQARVRALVEVRSTTL